MRKILILGSGAGGTIVANMLRKELVESEWEILKSRMVWGFCWN